jgi:tetratricopeptide (TPR) repeat protein
VQANHRLRGGTKTTSDADSQHFVAQIDQVEIFELYEDRAIEAQHVLGAITATPEFDTFVVDPLLAEGDEGLRRVRFEQANGWWQRLRVTGEEDDTITFEALTQAARAPMRLMATQRGLVDRFVERALETTADDPRLGQTLFELLVPNDFKPYAPDRRKLALMLNPRAAAIPWELMRDGFDRSPEPLSVSTGMIRQLQVADERLQVLRAPSATALVIGNPIVSDQRFPSLAGAAAEATSVATVLGEQRYDVQLLLEEAADPTSVLTAVHERPWRILHLAAHGVFKFDTGDGREPVSGLVLDDGIFFTAAEADQLRHVPELVFINCCHLGQTRGDASPRVAFHKLAANLATQFIRIGARAVVAAGWAVDDAAAKTFATAFYREMLRGQLYGDAVLTARSETYRRHGSTNTWGAYQCYGDPSFSLFTGTTAWPEDAFVSPHELTVWLEGQARAARQSGTSDELVAALERREAATPASWWCSASLSATAGDAFSQAGQFEKAIDYYERALDAEKATAPMAALEQLANCRVRFAGQLIRHDPPDTDRAKALLKQAEDSLRLLLDIGKTSERYALLGGAMKRRALLPGVKDARRRDALSKMSTAYKMAYDVSCEKGNPAAYALANEIAAEVVLSWHAENGDGHGADLKGLVSELRQQADALTSTRTDTFNLSAAADAELLGALVDRNADDAAWARVEEAFTRVLSRGATPRVRDSMRGQLRFLRQMAENVLPAGEGVVERLDRLDRSIG